MARGIGNFQFAELIRRASLPMAESQGRLPFWAHCVNNDYFKISPIKCKSGVLSYTVSRPSLSMYLLQHHCSPPLCPHSTGSEEVSPRHQRNPAEGLALTSALKCQHQSRCRLRKPFLLHSHSTGEGRDDFMPISHINSSIKMNSCTN